MGARAKLFSLLFFLALLGAGAWVFFQGGEDQLPPGENAGAGEASPSLQPPSPSKGGKKAEPSQSAPALPGGDEGPRRKALAFQRGTSPQKILLSGRVLGPGGKGVPGAQVLLITNESRDTFFFLGRDALARTRTDRVGNWRLSLPAKKGAHEERYQVTASKDGFVPGAAFFLMGSKTEKIPPLTIHLLPGTPLLGFVRDEQGRPVKEARLTVWRKGPLGPGIMGMGPVFSDKEGRYSFPGLPEGVMTVNVGAKGFAPASREVCVGPAGPALTVDFRLTRGAVLSGKVLDGGGKPVAGALVDLQEFWKGIWVPVRIEAGRSSSLKTGTFGGFRFENLDQKGRFRLEVKAKGFLAKTLKSVHPGGKEVVVVLSRGGGVKGRALDHEGNPVPSFTVEGSRRFGWVSRTVRGRKDGTFLGRGLEPGVWAFRARRGEGLYSPPVGIKLSGEEVVDLGILRLPKPAALVVAVLDGRGKPVSDFPVESSRNRDRNYEIPIDEVDGGVVPAPGSPEMARFFYSPERGPSGKTGKDGLCRLGGLSPGLWWVRGGGKDLNLGWSGPVRLEEGEEKKTVIRAYRGGSLLILARERDGTPRPGEKFNVEQVEMGEKEEGISFFLRTDSEGKAGKSGIPPGVYKVHLYRDLLSPEPSGVSMSMSVDTGKAWEIRVEEGKTARLEIVLKKRWKIRGRILGPDGAPAKGLVLWLLPTGKPYRGPKQGRTGPGGTFDLEEVEGGGWLLVWGRPGDASWGAHALRLSPEGGTLEKDLVLSHGSLTGKVVDSQGRPLEGILVQAGRAGPEHSMWQALAFPEKEEEKKVAPYLQGKEAPLVRTDPSGGFTLKGLFPGTWTFYIKKEKDGKVLASKKVKVSGGETVDVGEIRVEGA